MRAVSLFHINNKTSVLKAIELPKIENQLMLTSAFSMISLGTERTVASGSINPYLNDLMKVPYMRGRLSLPCTYGYSLVARFNAKYVHLMHPHQDKICVSPSDVVEIPDGIEPETATLIPNLETALTGFWDASKYAKEEILICGFGSIGFLLAWLFSKNGHTVYILEKNPGRQKMAQDFGFRILRDRSGFSLAVNTSGSGDGLNECIKRLQKDGVVMEMSWFGSAEIKLKLGHEFHFNRLKIVSSQVSSIPPDHPEWTCQSRKEEVIGLLKDKFLSSLPLNIIPFNKTPEFFDKVRNGDIEDIFNVIQY